ncbi:FAD-dependent oxidoreductase, partial [Phenylobacterium sp.]|uniref:FAD-dependent oxidoreductase n=1 Tax=Phenylobacterium sp. TaxID=1871053 RepID=UPI0039836A6E
MSAGPRVTVAGAGALGLASALALADAGCRVTVCDPEPAGANASGVAAGMLAPVFEALLDPQALAHFGLLMAARDLWPALARRAGVDLDRSGALAIGAEAWLARTQAGARRLGVRLTERAPQDLAPGVSQAFRRALLTREDWRLEAPAALAQLRHAAHAAGVAFRTEPVTGRGDADLLVIATGAGTAAATNLTDTAPELASLSPIKGHILTLPDAPTPQVTIRGEGVYLTPGEGGLMVGATMEHGAADPTVDAGRAAPLLAAAARLFPALANAAFTTAAGVRAATPDGLPLVGWSTQPGVLLAVGARRNGWLLAPLVARIVAAHVSGADAGAYAAR